MDTDVSYNWSSTEPNNSGGETCLSILKVGSRGIQDTEFSWNDIPFGYTQTINDPEPDSYKAKGYFVEFGDKAVGSSETAPETYATATGIVGGTYDATVLVTEDGAALTGKSVQLRLDDLTYDLTETGTAGTYSSGFVPASTYSIYVDEIGRAHV